LAAFTLKPYLKEYRNDIRLVYLNYPLDNACNVKIGHAMHPVSCLAAKAGACAHKMGKFWEYHDLVFENQKRLSRSTLLEIADQVHLDKAGFEACLASDEAAKIVQDDLAQGEIMDVHGTPSLFLNGRLFKDWTNPNRLRTILEAEIRKP
jgi:protein-disulfide isomerase